MSFQILDTDGTVADTIAFGTVDAGDTSSTKELVAWMDRGVPGGMARNINLEVQVQIAGVWVRSGTPVLDYFMFQIRSTTIENPSNATVEDAATSWQRVGPDVYFPLKDTPGNVGRHFEVRLVVPILAGVSGSPVTFRIIAKLNSTVSPIAGAIASLLGPGILTGYGDTANTSWVEGPTTAESGTPDDQVQIGARTWLYAGVEDSQTSEAVTLNQTALSGSLTSGQSYIAIISQDPAGTTATTTKGNRSTAPVAPDLPTGHLPIARVTVAYQAGGTSVITDSNITRLATDGLLKPSAPATGLTLTIAPGKAIVPGMLYTQSGDVTVSLTPSVTRYLWLDASNSFVQTATNVRPTVGAVRLASVTTDGSDVTSLTDMREFLLDFRAVTAASGSATAGGTWTGTEQAMLQAAYDKVRVIDAALARLAGL